MPAGVHSPSHCLHSLQPADKGLEPWHLGLSLHALSCEVKSRYLQVTQLIVHISCEFCIACLVPAAADPQP